MKFSEVISRLKEFYKTENLDKLSHNIGININSSIININPKINPAIISNSSFGLSFFTGTLSISI